MAPLTKVVSSAKGECFDFSVLSNQAKNYSTMVVFFLMSPFFSVISVGEVSYDTWGESFLSTPLVILSFWVGGMSLLIGSTVNKHAPPQLLASVIVLVGFLVFGFIVMNGVLFYMAFEGSLVPICFLIIKWGHNPERLEATSYLILYTVLGGSVHMVSLVMMDEFLGSCSFLSVVSVSSCDSDLILSMWWGGIILPFLIKAPCYGFHLWLPKAHVEAPVMGSMILAAVMLKLGIYGLMRYSSLFLMPLGVSVVVQVMGIVGGVMSGASAVRQVDMKGVIAYASIGHMSFSVAGLTVFSSSGDQGVVYLMISHGLASSGLFAWAGIVYDKFYTRNLLLLSGIRIYSPCQSFCLALLLMGSGGIPPFLSFFGELFIFSCLVLSWGWVGGILLVYMLVEVLYSVLLFLSSQHSGLMGGSMGVRCISGAEWLVLYGHIVPLLLMFVSPTLMIV